MPISRRITLLYGTIFTISTIIVCLFITMNASIIFESQTKTQLSSTISNIKEAAKESNIENISVEDCLDDKYVELVIKNVDTDEIYTNTVGERPEVIDALNIMKELDLKKYIDLEDINPTTHIVNVNESLNRIMVSQDKIETENGRYVIIAYKFFEDNFESIKAFVVRMLIFNAICIYIVFMIGQIISKKMIKPISDVTHTAARMSIENLGQRIDVPEARDEVRDLCLTFNSMLERLEDSFKKQERFVSDASHELRTPIAVIQGYANLLNRWGKNDPVIMQESIDSIIAETDHMSVLIKKLLFLAKGDQQKIEVEKELIELGSIVESAVKDMSMLGFSHKMTYECNENAYILGDGDLIKQLLCIFIENSFKYTPDNGDIKVSVWREKENVFVNVSDTGCGIEKEKIPYIFDRFYKADEARSAKVPGTGIGLSIAKWIIDIHQGSVNVESEINKGTSFTVKFKSFKEIKQEI